MTEQEAIKMLERTKMLCGLPDQGGTWKPNAETMALEMAISALEEIQQYRSIGTVEECREARERLKEKKPLSRTHRKDGNHPLSQDIGRCPSCNCIVAEDMLWCDDCGQKLDWR